MRYFNVSGPCFQDEHYMIEAATRLRGVEQLIDMNQYFVIHAARQSGKTTYLKDLANRLNGGGRYYCAYCSLESLQEVKEPEIGIAEIVARIKMSLETYKIPEYETFAKNADFKNFTKVLQYELTKYCKTLDKPFVLLFDEADCLSNGALITFLRQLRNGYIDRDKAKFVKSIALVGMRNIRDYKAKIRPDSETLGSASPFNIVTKTLTLNNFTKEEIKQLYEQHTIESEQIFEPAAIDLVWEKTQGQPWLVNAIVREVIFELLDFDFKKTITAKLCEEAIQNIILRRDVHIDSLLERLKEDRVRSVIEPMILGEDFSDRLSDDYQYVTDLGVIKSIGGKIQPANPIYGEVIARTLSYDAQEKLKLKKPDATIPHYLKNGKIDINSLMQDFQQFWRENSAIWVEKFFYKEAAPHLILMAFLQRILNGGGHIIRDMGAGTGRTDLCVVYENQKYPIELKIRRGDKSVSEGIEQTMRYMDTFGCSEGWLAVFDQRLKIDWDEKIYIKKETVDGKTVTVFGL